MKTRHLYLRAFTFENINDMFHNRSAFIEKGECFRMHEPDDVLYVCVDVAIRCDDNKLVRTETFVEDCNVSEFNELTEQIKKSKDASSQLPAPARDC